MSLLLSSHPTRVSPRLALCQVNAYRGSTFDDLFSEYHKASGRPLLLGGYGVDAYDTIYAREDEESHAR